MCLAVPALVVETLNAVQQAVIELGGLRKTISTALVGEVTEGEYLLVHVGYAIGRIDPLAAQQTLAELKTLRELEKRHALFE